MKFFGMGWVELIIILVVILLIFGPKNLPKLGAAIGKTMKNLRAGLGSSKKKAAAENPVEAEPEVLEAPVDEPEAEAAPQTIVANVADEVSDAVTTVEEKASEVEDSAIARAQATVAKAEKAFADAEADSQEVTRTVKRVVKRIN
ncbi:MAG: twin-arginine translocase TatA/TatE family subunit [Eggerthellaceae bacterium]|nr:twin-arginine translocase TatA/TatE family subunit [Eggerthellaceae bacterium]